MKIKRGDNVKIISGKDRGKNGKILEVFPKTNKVRVEGINLRKKHTRPKKQGQKGQMIQVPLPIDVSNIMLICSICNKPRRTGYKNFSVKSKSASGGKKTRVCKKCGSEI